MYDPVVVPFFGCQPHTRAAIPPRGRPAGIPEYPPRPDAIWTGYRSGLQASEDVPAGEPCVNCGAVYAAGPESAARKPLTIATPPDIAEATGIAGVATGLNAGDDWRVCGRCLCLSPANRGKVAAGTSPRPRRLSKSDELAARVRPRLTKAERSGIKADAPRRIRAVVAAFLAFEAAIAAGDEATAVALDALLRTAGTADPKAFAREFRRLRRGAARGVQAIGGRDGAARRARPQGRARDGGGPPRAGQDGDRARRPAV